MHFISLRVIWQLRLTQSRGVKVVCMGFNKWARQFKVLRFLICEVHCWKPWAPARLVFLFLAVSLIGGSLCTATDTALFICSDSVSPTDYCRTLQAGHGMNLVKEKPCWLETLLNWFSLPVPPIQHLLLPYVSLLPKHSIVRALQVLLKSILCHRPLHTMLRLNLRQLLLFHIWDLSWAFFGIDVSK